MKRKFPRARALAVCKELCPLLQPFTERLVVAGSLRRGCGEVGDIELVYVPKVERRPVIGDMFATNLVDLAELEIRRMIEVGILDLRPSSTGVTTFGAKNKLTTHVETGIPVDFFATVESSWFNYLVCRTGPKESNMRIAEAAQLKGWRWNPYGSGFTGPRGEAHEVRSEQDVFEFVGLPCREPKERV